MKKFSSILAVLLVVMMFAGCAFAASLGITSAKFDGTYVEWTVSGDYAPFYDVDIDDGAYVLKNWTANTGKLRCDNLDKTTTHTITVTNRVNGATATYTIGAAHVHTPVEIPAVPATCEDTGLTAGEKCSSCGMILVKQTVVEAKGHTPVEIPAVEATCSTVGYTAGAKCSTCGLTTIKPAEVEKLPHTAEVIPAVEATCSATGLTAGEKCSVCGEITVAQTEVEKLPHTAEVIPAVEATCTTAGLTAGEKCSVCDEITVAQTEVAALGHTWEEIPAKEPTFTEVGNTAGQKCTVCNLVEGAEEIPVRVPTGNPTYTVEKVTDNQGKVTYVEDDGTMPLEAIKVKLTWRYTMTNNEVTFAIQTVVDVKADGTFEIPSFAMPTGVELNFLYAEVLDAEGNVGYGEAAL